MNVTPVSFGMAAIYTDRGTKQFIKAAARTTEQKADAFIRASEQFKRDMDTTENVDVVVDKTGIIFPRLKSKVVDKTNGATLGTLKQPIYDTTDTHFFEESKRMTKKADKAYTTSKNFSRASE